MTKLRIYLDTSVINFLFAEDAPEKREITVEFFERVVRRSQTVFVSQLVLDEIGRTSDQGRRDQLFGAIRRYGLEFLPAEPAEDVAELVKTYLKQKAIPPNAADDALHVAICTVNKVDVLASWNFLHLANVNRERRITTVNESLGYVYPLRITTPLEVIDNE